MLLAAAYRATCFSFVSPTFLNSERTDRKAKRVSMQTEPVIQIRNLTKIYRDFWGRKKVRALNSLSLRLCLLRS